MPKEKSSLPPRPARGSRFQTAVAGAGFVPSAVGARFDPYAEPPRRLERNLDALERVDRVHVPQN